MSRRKTPFKFVVHVSDHVADTMHLSAAEHGAYLRLLFAYWRSGPPQDDNRVLVGLSFMFLAVCLLNMIGLLLAKFLGAAPLVGLRRALGASKSAIFRQHLVEVGVIGLGGGLLGIALAALGLWGVRNLYENYDELTRLDIPMVLTAIGIAVMSGLLAGFYPTWRVCRVQPAAYLKTQ